MGAEVEPFLPFSGVSVLSFSAPDAAVAFWYCLLGSMMLGRAEGRKEALWGQDTSHIISEKKRKNATTGIK